MRLWSGWQSWASARLALVLVALAVVTLGLLARAARGGDSWEVLLTPAAGVTQVANIQWLTPVEPGQWAVAVAEALPRPDANRVGAPLRDVILFEAMVDGDGQPFDVRRVGNLTSTPDADDALMATHTLDGRHLVVTSSTFDKALTGVSLFDLSGDPTIWRDEGGAKRPLGDSFKLSFTYWQDMGRVDGVLRRSYAFNQPVKSVEARFDDTHLIFSGMVQDEPKGPPREAWSTIRVLDGAALDVHASTLGLRQQETPWVIDSWIQFAVNRARAHPWIGATKIAILESYVFDRIDEIKQAYYGVVGADNTALAQELAPVETQAEPEPEPTLPTLEKGQEAILMDTTDQWPPPPVDPPGKQWGFDPVPGEGQWTPWVAKWMDRKAHRGPWPVYRTAVRVNPEKSYEHMLLLALDIRQLDLHLQAGIISPRSTTGYRGTGEIPRDPEVLKKVLLAFNGGFKTTHGAYGVVLDRRKFVPQKAAMASLAIYEDRAIRMGAWPGDANFGNYGAEKRSQQQEAGEDVAEVPADIVDLRQNLPPLVGNGELNPTGAVRWGGVVDHLTSTSTPRSGVCIKGDFTLVYVWGKSCSARDLGNAMLAAGCDFGMHLDMNPYHTGMAMYSIPIEGDKIPREGKEHRLIGTKAERASRQMHFIPNRYVGRDLKDFFYMTWRDNLPRRLGDLENFGPWSSKGLPVASAGLEPLMVQSTSKDKAKVTVMGLFGTQMKAAITPIPEQGQLPVQGAKGDVQVGLWVSEPVTNPQGRLALDSEAGRLVVEGVPSESDAVKGIASGTTLYVNGALAEKLPKGKFKQPLVAAQTLSGDLLLVTCQGCALRRLMDTLEALDVDAAVLLGSGGLNVISSDDALDWKDVHTSPDPQPITAQIKLTPLPLRNRTGLTDFKAPLPDSP